jgi:hypothetical protein
VSAVVVVVVVVRSVAGMVVVVTVVTTGVGTTSVDIVEGVVEATVVEVVLIVDEVVVVDPDGDEPDGWFTAKPFSTMLVEPEVLMVLSTEVPFGLPGTAVVLRQALRAKVKAITAIRLMVLRVRVMGRIPP